MAKISGDYKYKFMVIRAENKNQKNILIDALNEHIEKLTKQIEQGSKCEYRADCIVNIAKEIAQCMEWRDHIEFMGTDTGLRDLDFYKNGIERFY